MAEHSNIEWTDHTFNPWRGCSKVHTGCRNCYAEKNVGVKLHGIKWGTKKQGGTRVLASDGMWTEPVKWNKAAAEAGERHRVFCASLADVFEDWEGPILNHKGERALFDRRGEISTINEIGLRRLTKRYGAWAKMQDLRLKLFGLIDQTPYLDWLLLTKRPENIHRMWRIEGNGKDPGADDYARRDNVWLGTSVSDQETADRMIPELLKCRSLALFLFLSVEPLLGPIDLAPYLSLGIDWVIIGGESGKDARRCDIQWVHHIVEQCKAANVPCFVKQLGAVVHDGMWTMAGHNHPTEPNYLSLNHKKGGDINEWPEDSRVRQYPKVAP